MKVIDEIFDPKRSFQDQQSRAQEYFQQKFFAVKTELGRFNHEPTQYEKDFLASHIIGCSEPSLEILNGLLKDLEDAGSTKVLHAISYLREMCEIAERARIEQEKFADA